MKVEKIRINGVDYDIDGKSAYEIACDHGFVGTEEEWLESLVGDITKSAEDFANVAEKAAMDAQAHTSEQIEQWLNEHPEATTTVQDHSLTIDKMVVGTLNYVTPEMFGAVGDGVEDDTQALQRMFASGAKTFWLFGKYRVVLPSQADLHRFNHVDGVSVKTWGDSYVHINIQGVNGNRENPHYGGSFLTFYGCSNINIELTAKGNYDDVYVPTTGGNLALGDLGCSAVWLVGCKHANVNIDAEYLRFAVKINQITAKSQDEISEHINVKGSCESCGYFVSATSCRHLNVNAFTNKVHRSVYLAGVEHVNVDVSYGLVHTNTSVLITTNYLGDTLMGVKDARINAIGRYVDLAEEDPSGYFQKYLGSVHLASQEYDEPTPCVHSDIHVTAELFGLGNAGGLGNILDYVSGEKIYFDVYDYRDYTSSNCHVLSFDGDGCDRIPITLRCMIPSAHAIYATKNGKHAKLTIVNSELMLVVGGDIVLRDGCRCRVRELNSLVMEGGVSYPCIHVTNGANHNCTINGESCLAIFNVKGTMQNDAFVGKSSCVLTPYDSMTIKMYTVDESGNKTLIYQGTQTKGKQVYFPILTSNKLQFEVTGLNGSAVPTMVI